MIARTIRPNVSATPTCVTTPPLVSLITIAPVPAKTRANVLRNSAADFFTFCRRRNAPRKTNLFSRGSDRGPDVFLPTVPRASGEFRRVVKRPMQPSSYAGKNRAPFSFSFATHHYHELERSEEHTS